MLKYAQVVRTAAARHKGGGWRSYDIQVRLCQEWQPPRSWATVDGELWSLFVVHQLLDRLRWNKFKAGALFHHKRIKGFNFVANSPLSRKKKCKGSVLGTQVEKLQPLQWSCASISAKQAVQDRNANLTTSVRNVVQSDTGHRNVGIVESTNGPIHNKGTGCGKDQWCVCCKYPSPINLSALLPLLEYYPNKRSANILQDGFSEGFRFGYMGKGSLGSRIIWNLWLICRTK